ncbi:amino acid transporter AVT3C-like [Actinia tenebrosa]|uniref:Amino acid transporter AVT3C-like n=1 Tax=Actinia tenebrosa TaxID=6105 RepID=A0A6P8IXM2_ACTTE|nr:amino acid transporter AVT3C-like [Actinia tenebrosa]
MTRYKSVPSVATGVTVIRPTVFRQITDFANIFKSFIGTNWIALPFAFRQSGLLLGCIGLILIAMATDHCSHLIIKCKKAAVKKVLLSNPKYTDPSTSEEELEEIRDATEKKVMYGDIGRIALGKLGVVLVEVSLLATQFGFCIGYLIFIGNTIGSLFPVNTLLNVNSSQAHNSTDYHLDTKSTAPTFAILVLIPVLPLILMAFIRRVRKLGPVSFISNVSLLIAFTSVLGYMLSGLTFRIKDIKLAKWATFPVFFGQVTSSYEGMGTLIPIETSMGDNRKRYPLYLHLAIGIISLILGGFGIAGYLVYGDTTEQISTQMLPQGQPLVIIVQILLCLAILFTYPLQLYPITEVIESYIFKDGNVKKPPSDIEGQNDGDQDTSENEPVNEELIDSNSIGPGIACVNDIDETTELLSATDNKMKKPMKKKPNWRKNVLRTLLVLLTAGVAIALKDDFAYVGALCGSLGSSTLGFILPCIFHNVLLKETNSKLTVAKNYLLQLFGVVGGAVGVAVTITQIVKQFSK